MLEHVKMLPTNHIEIYMKGQQRHFAVPQEVSEGLLKILKTYESDWVPASEVFPELKDSSQRPAIALRGARQKEGLSQEELALKLGISQSDVSKMESGKRPIGKRMAGRLAQVLNIDARVFA